MKPVMAPVQMFLLLFLVQTGTFFINFPSLMINAAGRDSWWLFFALGLMHYPHLWLFERFYQDFRWTKIISILYGIYWFFAMVSITSYTVYTLNVYAFPKTPILVVILLITFVLFSASTSKTSTSVNLGVLMLPLIAIFLMFLMMSINNLEWTNLFPVGQLSSKELFKGFLAAQLPFGGMELYLLFRQLTAGKIGNVKLMIYSGIWLVFFMFMLIISLAFFSLKEFTMISEPIIYLLKSQEVTFAERLDLIFIYIWLAWSIISLCGIAFAIMRLMNIQRIKKPNYVAALLCIPYIPLVWYTSTKTGTELNGRILTYAHLVFAFALPLIVILFNRYKRRKEPAK